MSETKWKRKKRGYRKGCKAVILKKAPQDRKIGSNIYLGVLSVKHKTRRCPFFSDLTGVINQTKIKKQTQRTERKGP